MTTWRWGYRKPASRAVSRCSDLPGSAGDERRVRRLAHPEIRELPGRMNHRMPRLENGEIHPDPTVVFADRHDVKLVPGGAFAKLLGCETIRVNSLHGQGILEPGERVVVEGIAEDGTIEAIRIADAPGFALGVQWHAEYDPQRNPINRALFQAFGEAVLAGMGRG